VALHDELEFTRSNGGVQLTCSDPSLPVDSSNLVHRASEAFLQAANIKEGASIHLEKRIPIAAGLGGGSGQQGHGAEEGQEQSTAHLDVSSWLLGLFSSAASNCRSEADVRCCNPGAKHLRSAHLPLQLIEIQEQKTKSAGARAGSDPTGFR